MCLPLGSSSTSSSTFGSISSLQPPSATPVASTAVYSHDLIHPRASTLNPGVMF